MNHPLTFEMPTTDKLTGLLNMTYFRHLLREDCLPKSVESGDPLTLLFMDIDNFGTLNAANGHECGDRLLTEAARVLRASLPENAVIARYGGDEFAAILPDTRVDDAFTLAEELRRRISAMSFEEWPEARVACCIGLAAFPGHGSHDVELIRQADEALYTAKTTGRNKVALPLSDSRMVTKTSHYTATQLERLAQLAKTLRRNEAGLLREALDDVLKKHNDRLGQPVKE